MDYFFLVPFLATKEVLAPLANDPIMLGRSIRLFRYPECQGPSIILDYIGNPNGSEKKWEKSEEQEQEEEE